MQNVHVKISEWTSFDCIWPFQTKNHNTQSKKRTVLLACTQKLDCTHSQLGLACAQFTPHSELTNYRKLCTWVRYQLWYYADVQPGQPWLAFEGHITRPTAFIGSCAPWTCPIPADEHNDLHAGFLGKAGVQTCKNALRRESEQDVAHVPSQDEYPFSAHVAWAEGFPVQIGIHTPF